MARLRILLPRRHLSILFVGAAIIAGRARAQNQDAPTRTEPAAAQGLVRGCVRSRGLRRPIPGAIIEKEDGLPVAEANDAGDFEALFDPGLHSLRVRAPGYQDAVFTETVRAGERVNVVYRLNPRQSSSYETVVRGRESRFEESRVSLRGEEVKEIPGTLGDPLRVAMLLPGVSSLVSGLGYPIVRGTQPAATAFFLEGVRIPILYHLLLGPSVFHPDFISSLDVYVGVPPAQYGRVLGGAVEVQVSRPHDNQLHASAYVDVLNSGAFMETPLPGRGSVTVAARYSLVAPLLATSGNAANTLPQTRDIFSFWDYQARYEQPVGPGSIRVLAFGSSDIAGTESTGASGVTELYSVAFHRADLRWRQRTEMGTAEVGVTAGIDRTGAEAAVVNNDYVLRLDDESIRVHAGATSEWTPSLELEAGIEAERRRDAFALVHGVPEQGFNGPDAPLMEGLHTLSTLDVFTAGLYSKLSWTPESWRVEPGFRIDSYHLSPSVEYLVAEPRLSVRRWLWPACAVTFSGGLYHQPPTALASLPALDWQGLRYTLQAAWQTDLGLEWQTPLGFELRVDGYWNPLVRTLEVDPFDLSAHALGGVVPQAIFDNSVRQQITHGTSRGIEVMIRRPLGGAWFGWLSYSYQQSTRVRTFSRYDPTGQVIGTATATVPFDFDQTHVLNATVSVKLPWRITAGATLHFNSGYPEAGRITSYTQTPGSDGAGGAKWVPVDLDHLARLPSFFRVDLRAAKEWVFDDFRLQVYLDVANASNAAEVVGFQYSQSSAGLLRAPNVLQLLIPSLGIKGSY